MIEKSYALPLPTHIRIKNSKRYYDVPRRSLVCGTHQIKIYEYGELLGDLICDPRYNVINHVNGDTISVCIRDPRDEKLNTLMTLHGDYEIWVNDKDDIALVQLKPKKH